MRSTAIQRGHHDNISFCFPEEPLALRRMLRYWPLDLDIHNQKLAALRNSPVDRWFRYIRSLSLRRLTSPEAAGATEGLWMRLTEEIQHLPPPNASPTDDCGVLMSWTRGGHHLEIEVMADGTYEWFYRHRASNTSDTGRGDEDDPPNALLGRLAQVIH